ncbi:unnamed protein product [Cylindrotheca closterium]|uniref:Uncharacterized protein n=1 Tax=Cylindrotheca closterium TaxID=2856 RepID=A0AAD2CEF1_9STRA|nr:unnamed protein product [Cylindrotheca closterium]
MLDDRSTSNSAFSANESEPPVTWNKAKLENLTKGVVAQHLGDVWAKVNNNQRELFPNGASSYGPRILMLLTQQNGFSWWMVLISGRIDIAVTEGMLGVVVECWARLRCSHMEA